MNIDFIPTFTLELNPYSLIMSRDGIIRADKFVNGMNVYSYGDAQKIINSINGLKKHCKTLILQNGNSLVLEDNNTVYTNSGWKKIKDLGSEDLILNKLTIYNSSIGAKPLNWKNVIKGTMLNIQVPQNNSEALSEWMGIMSQGGYLNDDNNKVGIVTGDTKLGEHFVKLTKQLFDITPVKFQDKRENRNAEYYFISKNLIEFLITYLGNNYALRKIPLFLQEGSVAEQLAFIKGVSAWSTWEQGKLVVYSGLSKPSAEFVSQVLRHQGYDVSLSISKLPNNDLQSRYEVKVYGKHPKLGVAVNFFKDEDDEINFKSPQFLVNSEPLLTHKVRSFHPRYDSVKKARQNQKAQVFADLLTSVGLSLDEYYWEPIREIKDLGVKDVINLKILHPTGVVLNQIVLGGQI